MFQRIRSGRFVENSNLLVGSLLRLLPDGIDLVFYLGDFIKVSTSFMVGYLGGEFVDFLLVLSEEQDSEKRE